MTWAAVAVLLGALGAQAFWLARALDEVARRLDRIDDRLDGVEGAVLRDHGERIARLEERMGA